jgi:hypothetical protein
VFGAEAAATAGSPAPAGAGAGAGAGATSPAPGEGSTAPVVRSSSSSSWADVVDGGNSARLATSPLDLQPRDLVLSEDDALAFQRLNGVRWGLGSGVCEGGGCLRVDVGWLARGTEGGLLVWRTFWGSRVWCGTQCIRE